jgi:hypothetical protein
VKKACAKAHWKPGPGRRGRHGVRAWERSGSFGDEVSGSLFEITGKGFGMQRSFYLKLEQAGEFVAIAHRTCLFYQVLQDHTRVICAPEKRPVNPFRAALHHWRRYHTSTMPNTALKAMPMLVPSGKKRETVRVKRAMAAAATANKKTK